MGVKAAIRALFHTDAPQSPLPRRKVHFLGYDATDTTSQRRKKVGTTLKSEDAALGPSSRKKLVNACRELVRNFPTVGWAIRKHRDYVASHTFQSRTGDKGLDEQIEELVRDWSLPRHCDVAGRHSLSRQVRLAEMRRIIDGDVFAALLSDGRIQWIEGDRVCKPTMGGLPPKYKEWKLIHGIRVTKAGRARSYCVCRRGGVSATGFVFDKMLPAAFVIHHGFFDGVGRFDQIRGISPLAAAANMFRDAYEAAEYALAKMKVSQAGGLVVESDLEEPLPIEGEGETETESPYDVDLGKAPWVITAEPGDKIHFIESQSPSQEFQQYWKTITGVALKALDIPYSFYDEAHTNYSGARQALLQYEQSAATHRSDVQSLLNRLTGWRLRLWLADGELKLPRGMAPDALRWEWVKAGLPWIDPFKEVKADKTAVAEGFSSTPRICKRLGVDAHELVDEQVAWAQYRRDRFADAGVPLPQEEAPHAIPK